MFCVRDQEPLTKGTTTHRTKTTTATVQISQHNKTQPQDATTKDRNPREPSSYQTKQSLRYDLQEPFRWIADVAVMEAFESGVLDLPDFYFTGEDYRYRFEQEAKERFLDSLQDRFNSEVRYKERALKWDTVIEQKATELGRYLSGRTGRFDFSEPSPNLHKTDDRELRRHILALSQSEAHRLGIRKSTLHYLRRNVRERPSLKVYGKVRKKLELKSD